jgi:hypothetical protein
VVVVLIPGPMNPGDGREEKNQGERSAPSRVESDHVNEWHMVGRGLKRNGRTEKGKPHPAGDPEARSVGRYPKPE